MFFEVSELSKRFGGLTAVAEVSFSITRGEIVGIFGPNGSGKTTLLNLICGMLPPSGGRLIWKDQDVTGRAPHQVAELGIVKTFQNPQLFPELSVIEHVWIAAHLRLKRMLGLAAHCDAALNRRRMMANCSSKLIPCCASVA